MPTNPFEPPKEVGAPARPWLWKVLGLAMVAAVSLLTVLVAAALIFVASIFVSEWLRLAL
jgi:hypothetical protein